MSVFHNNILAGASGAAGGASGPLYVDDVFSTHLYKGNGSSQQITNGIDLAGEGGLLWTKIRGSSGSHALFDSERGTGYSIYTDSSSSQDSRSDISSFNSDGFTLGIAGVTNTSNDNFCSWTFRKAPGFFDIVTYSGNSTSGRTVSHNLGSVPGFIIIKALNDSRHFWCFHRSLGNTMAIPLSTNGATTTAAAYWNNTTPTDTVFTLGNDLDVNASGTNYVAYVFAHDDQSFGTDEDEAIIKCDQYTGNGSTDGPEINLGFEPQWVMIKARDESGSFRNWGIFDNMRGVIAGTGDKVLAANLPTQEDSGQNSANRNFIEFLPTGFKLSSEGLNLTDNSGNRYIYIAIRRPHKPPGAGTDVFNVTTTAINTNYTTGFAPDVAWIKSRSSSSYNWFHGTRLTGSGYTAHNSDNAEQSGGSWAWANPTNTFKSTEVSDDPLTYTFKRAPGFMDVVCYNGTGSNRDINHNLTVAPEMMWIKRRNNNDYWSIYHSAQTNIRYHSGFRSAEKFEISSSYWNSTSPTAEHFTVGTDGEVNGSGNTYFAVLWATLAGVSKVGSYNGTGSALNIDCGFTSGARLVIIKRANTVTSGSGNTDASHWFVFNSTRGIVSGNDPFLLLNEMGTEFTGDDAIDPLNSGFTVVGGGKGLNVSGGQYVFLAIA